MRGGEVLEGALSPCRFYAQECQEGRERLPREPDHGQPREVAKLVDRSLPICHQGTWSPLLGRSRVSLFCLCGLWASLRHHVFLTPRRRRQTHGKDDHCCSPSCPPARAVGVAALPCPVRQVAWCGRRHRPLIGCTSRMTKFSVCSMDFDRFEKVRERSQTRWSLRLSSSVHCHREQAFPYALQGFPCQVSLRSGRPLNRSWL